MQGNENLALFSSLFHVGANPALCGLVVRPNEEKQNTLGNIMATGVFTVNHILPDFYKKAHQCSARYAEGVSEFNAVGLTPEYTDAGTAPFVKESHIKFACKLVRRIDIDLNGTFILIGEITSIIAPEDCLYTDGTLDLEKAGTITVSGLNTYHTTHKLGRLSYAKTDKPIEEL